MACNSDKCELNFITELTKNLPVCHPFIENIDNLSTNVKKKIMPILFQNH
jgi:hypothetical protein